MPLVQLRRWLRSLIGVKTLPAEAAYALWAATYADHAHNPLMRAEENAMYSLLPPMRGARVVDVACGTGRWGRVASEHRAASLVGFDNSFAMLRHALRSNASLRNASQAGRAQANMLALPCPADSFDVALCGLAIGHLLWLEDFIQEMARVLASGGTLLLSHFHAAGHRAGWQREFTTADGQRVAVAHQPHTLDEVTSACAAFGFAVDAIAEPRVGIEITENFPGSDDLYRNYHGLPALLVVRARQTS